MDEVTKFIQAYRDAFGHGPRAVAEFYSEPCVTARMAVIRVNATRSDTERLFAEVVRELSAGKEASHMATSFPCTSSHSGPTACS